MGNSFKISLKKLENQKREQKLLNIPSPHRSNVLIIMDLVSRPFDRSPILVHRDGGIDHTKIKASCQMAKGNFNSREEEVNWNQNAHVTSAFSIHLKSKTPNLLNLSDCKRFTNTKHSQG